MRTVRIECGNVDSCTPGTSHLYPAIGQEVVLLLAQSLQVRGEERQVDVPGAWPFTVFEIDPEGHHIVAPMTKKGQAVLVYVPIDDLDWPDRLDLIEEES